MVGVLYSKDQAWLAYFTQKINMVGVLYSKDQHGWRTLLERLNMEAISISLTSRGIQFGSQSSWNFPFAKQVEATSVSLMK
jgi:hypothetical protein